MNKYKNILLNTSLVIFSLAIVEIILQLAGYIYLNQYKKEVNFKNEKEIRILCIGESTTALGGKNSYPSQLEYFLQKEIPSKKIVVINEGLPGTVMFFMRNNFEAKIKKYKPHFVIVMAGINDLILSVEDQFGKTAFTEKLKLIKFFKIAYINLRERFIKEKLAREGVESIESKRHNKIFKETIDTCKSVPANCEKSLKNLIAFINKLTSEKKHFIVDFENIYLNHFLLKNKMYYDAYKKNIEKSSVVSKEYTLYRLNKRVCDLSLKQCKKKNYKEKFDKEKKYNSISLFLIQSKNIINSYEHMISISIKEKVKFVLMSYPLLSTDLYKNKFKKYPLVYVDNKKVFQKALQRESYDKIFYDQFSGVFGHATEQGNEIIAKNIINTIKKELIK